MKSVQVVGHGNFIFGNFLHTYFRPLSYEEGDSLPRHMDTASVYDPEANLKSRPVSIVVFLNSQGQTGDTEGYTGGDLTVFGLIDNDKFKKYGYPLSGEAGTLVAFREDCAHEVTKVTEGVRLVINSGFFRP